MNNFESVKASIVSSMQQQGFAEEQIDFVAFSMVSVARAVVNDIHKETAEVSNKFLSVLNRISE